jgi:hypothetical protein
MKKDNIKGGLADKLTLEDIAKKHNVSIEDLKKELAKGIEVESEHTSDKNIAKEIAMDHLAESPTYYTDLAKIEKVTETYNHIKKLLREALESHLTDETNDSTTYNLKYKGRDAGHVVIGPTNPNLGKDAMEIVSIELHDKYDSLKIFIDSINHLWQMLPNVNRLIIVPKDKDMTLWEKAGATRINNTYYELLRGH